MTSLPGSGRRLAWVGVAIVALFVAWALWPGGRVDAGAVGRGEALFAGKGGCTLCHTLDRTTPKDARGPGLGGIGGRAAARAAAFGIEGSGAATRFLVRAIVRPGADVTKGFDPMAETWLPSGLDDGEIRDLVAYLQSLGGEVEPAELPEDWIAAKREDYAREVEVFSTGDPAAGRKLLYTPKSPAICFKCHRIDGHGKDICPDLSEVYRVQRPGYLLESILDSSARIVRGYRQLMIWDKDGRISVGLPKSEDDAAITLIVDDDGNTEVIQKKDIDEQRFSDVSKMPGDFGQQMTAKQILDIVAFLRKHGELAAAPEGRVPAGPVAGKAGGTAAPAAAAPSYAVFEPVRKEQEAYRMAMERGDPGIGGRIYAHYCVMCHGSDGTGTGFNAVHLETKPANHTDDRRMAKTEDRLLHGVVSRGGIGTGRSFLMPPWGGTFSDRERWDLVAYLRSLHTALGR